MKPKLPNQLRKRQFIGLSIFGVLIIISQFIFSYYKNHSHSEIADIQFINSSESSTPLLLSEFNPNDLDEKQWQNLGFSDKQVKTILNYKKVVGGQFLSKEQLKKCYGISEQKFNEIEPYILLPETNLQAKSGNYDFKKFAKRELVIPGRFNPDNFSANDWVKMGFSEGQANAILKYKGFLGGSFVSKEKFKECFIISAENYSKLAPFLILPEKTPENFRNYASKSFEKPKIQYKNFDPNLLDAEGWKSLGFSEKQAQVIVNYRDRNMHGSFRTLEDIQKCFVINADKFEELKPYIQLNPENFKTSAPTQSYTKTENPAPEVKTDFSKVDLNQITFKQLREFGLSEKDAAMLLSFRKKLGGFINKEQALETFEIDKTLTSKLIYSTQLNSSNVQKYTILDAPEDWLKNHPYFKYSADKIIYFRLSTPDEKKLWKFLKLKPEYEAKMRLYLK